MKFKLVALSLLVSGVCLAEYKAVLNTQQPMSETALPNNTVVEQSNSSSNGSNAVPNRDINSSETNANVFSQKKAVGINVTPPVWYASRQTFTNLLQGGTWSVNWANVPSDKLNAAGYPLNWNGMAYTRLLGGPTGTWVRSTSVACSWKGPGTVNFSGGVNQVRGDHTLAFDMPSWNGKISNNWFSVWGFTNAQPLTDFECHDSKVASGNEFSREIVDSSKKYQVLRFMDWNNANGSPVRTWATRVDPRSLDNPGLAFENQFKLAKLANADVWFNHSWNDDTSYIQGVAKYAHDNLPAGHKVYVELSNEVWNWQFGQARLAYDEGVALKLDPNPGYGAWQNYSRRVIGVMKIWEKAFADRPKDLVRVLGTQVAYAEVTRQEMKYPDIENHVDAIAGAPYFSHDRSVPYTDALLQANVTSTIAGSKEMCDIARMKAPKIRCVLYEGGQHELPTALLPQEQFEKLERSAFMGYLYYQYLKTIQNSSNDLVVLFKDVDPIGPSGAWGQQEYGGQVGAPKQTAVDIFLRE